MSENDFSVKSVPSLPQVKASEPRPRPFRRDIIEQILREKSSELLNKLWNGKWSAQDESNLRALVDELKKRNVGAWNDRIYSAISDDGLIFEKENKICVDGGSAFEAVATADGTVKIVSVNFDVESIITRRGVSGRMDLSVSEDGLNFTREMRFRVIDLYIKDTIDPDIVLLPDGNLRIYYLTSWRGGGTLAGKILSAISRNGYTFWQEPGIRFENLWRGIDHKVLRIDDEKYKMFNHTMGKEGKVIHSATSRDGGMSFIPDEEPTGLSGMVVSATAFDDGFRLYYHVNTEEGAVVKSGFSKDGDSWKEEQGVRLRGGGCPSVVKLKDERYRMYYGVRGEGP